MKRNKILALFGTLLIAGQIAFVTAAGTPGSKEDPVVTESYVTAKINAIKPGASVDTSALEKRIEDLELKVASLEKVVIELQNSTNNSNGSNNSGSTSNVSVSDVNVLYHLVGLNRTYKYGAIAIKNTPLKESPSTSSKTLDTLPYYAGVNIIDANNGWVKIKYYDKTGWIQYKEVLPIMKTN